MVYAHKPDIERQTKMSETSKQGVFVGISEMYKGYVVYFPKDGTFEAAIHCDFVPNEFPLQGVTVGPRTPPLPPVIPLPPVHIQEKITFRVTPPIPTPSTMATDNQEDRDNDDENTQNGQDDGSVTPILTDNTRVAERVPTPTSARRNLYGSYLPNLQIAAARQPIPPPDAVAPREPQQDRTPAPQRNLEPRRLADPHPRRLAEPQPRPQNTQRPNDQNRNVPLDDRHVRFDPQRIRQRPTAREEENRRDRMMIGQGQGHGGARGLGLNTQGRGGLPERGAGHAPHVGGVGLRGTTLPTRRAVQTRGTTERVAPPTPRTLRTTNVGSPVAIRANDAPPANTTRRE